MKIKPATIFIIVLTIIVLAAVKLVVFDTPNNVLLKQQQQDQQRFSSSLTEAPPKTFTVLQTSRGSQQQLSSSSSSSSFFGKHNSNKNSAHHQKRTADFTFTSDALLSFLKSNIYDPSWLRQSEETYKSLESIQRQEKMKELEKSQEQNDDGAGGEIRLVEEISSSSKKNKFNSARRNRMAKNVNKDIKPSLLREKEFNEATSEEAYYEAVKTRSFPRHHLNTKHHLLQIANQTSRLRDFPLAIAARQFHHFDMESLKNPKLEIWCTLSMLHTRNCDPWKESFFDCYLRIGRFEWEKVLNQKCVQSEFWNNILPAESGGISCRAPKAFLELNNEEREESNFPTCLNRNFKSPRDLSKGAVWDSQKQPILMKTPAQADATEFPADEKVFFPPFPAPRLCKTDSFFWSSGFRQKWKWSGKIFEDSSNNNNNSSTTKNTIDKDPNPDTQPCHHFPFGFATPRQNFAKSVPRTKFFDWNPLMPQIRGSPRGETRYDVGVDDEDIFHELNAESFFSWSHRRGGFDCERFYSQIAAGTVPFFWDIDRCPKNTLGHYPKDILMKIIDPESQLSKELGVSEITERKYNGPIGSWRYNDNINSGTSSSSLQSRYVFRTQYMYQFIRQGEINTTTFNVTRYYELADGLLKYGKKYLSTRSLAAYVMKNVGLIFGNKNKNDDVTNNNKFAKLKDLRSALGGKKVLILGRHAIDYLQLSVFHGFSDLGIKTVLFSRYRHYSALYARRFVNSNVTSRQDKDDALRGERVPYGLGFGFAQRLNYRYAETPWSTSLDTLQERIRDKEFGLVLIMNIGGFRKDPSVAASSDFNFYINHNNNNNKDYEAKEQQQRQQQEEENPHLAAVVHADDGHDAQNEEDLEDGRADAVAARSRNAGNFNFQQQTINSIGGDNRNNRNSNFQRAYDPLFEEDDEAQKDRKKKIHDDDFHDDKIKHPYELIDEIKKSGAKIGFLQFRDAHQDPDWNTAEVCQMGVGPVFIREMSDKSC